MAFPKSDGRVRFCGNIKVTVNQFFMVDQYPLPAAQDLCDFGWEKEVFQTGPLTGLRPARTLLKLTEILYAECTSRLVSVYKYTFWHSSRHSSEDDGHNLAISGILLFFLGNFLRQPVLRSPVQLLVIVGFPPFSFFFLSLSLF